MRATYQIKKDGPCSFGAQGSRWISGRVYETNDPAELRRIMALGVFDVVVVEAPAPPKPKLVPKLVPKAVPAFVPAPKPVRRKPSRKRGDS